MVLVGLRHRGNTVTTSQPDKAVEQALRRLRHLAERTDSSGPFRWTDVKPRSVRAHDTQDIIREMRRQAGVRVEKRIKSGQVAYELWLEPAEAGLEARRAADRSRLLDQIDAHPDYQIPCRAAGPTAWWTSDEPGAQEAAAAACRAGPCPALAACAAYGLRWTDELGAYGGMTEKQRRQEAKSA